MKQQCTCGGRLTCVDPTPNNRLKEGYATFECGKCNKRKEKPLGDVVTSSKKKR